MMRTTLLLFLLLASGQVAYSQDAPLRAKGTSPDALQTFFSAPEQVLPLLYTAAIAHSGEVERLEALHSVADEDVKLAKQRILNSIALSTGYTYGTLPYFATAESSASPVYLPNPFGLGARAQFNIGAGIVMPLDMLASRNTNIRRQEHVVDQTIAQRKTQETLIRQQVIIQYQALLLAHVTQQAALEGWQSASIGKKIADKRFKDGEIQIDEQMASQDLYTKAVLVQEEARNRYQTAQLLLEDMIGTSINNIMLGK